VVTLLRGALVLFPTLDGINPADFATIAASQVDSNGGDSIRIAVFGANYRLDTKQLVATDLYGRTLVDSQLVVGTKRANDPTGNGYWRTILPAGTFLRGGGDAVELVFPANAQSLGLQLNSSGAVAPLAQGHRTFVLDLGGPTRGAIRFSIDVDARVAEAMGGMRLFQPAGQSGPSTILRPCSYPLFALGGATRFDSMLDFASPYEEEKLASGAVMPRTMLYPPPPPLETNLHAVHGHRVTIRPEGGAGLRLVRSPRAVSILAGKVVIKSLEHYLAPYGSFEVAAAARTSVFRLGLGLSNTESLRIDPGAGDRIEFGLGPALVGDAGPAKALGISDDLGAADGAGLTAWAKLARNGATDPKPLAIDPEGLPGYREGSTSMPFAATRYNPPIVAFPVMPLLGLVGSKSPGGKPADRIQLERDVVARVRRKLLVDHASMLGRARIVPPAIVARMPQGYLAERSAEDTPWSAVTFGRLGRAGSAGPSNSRAVYIGQFLAFAPIGSR
jgi:hypothetical protein